MVLELTNETFPQEILDHKGVALVDFWAPWCGPCNVLAPTIEELATSNANRVKVAKVNVDENREMAANYGIRSIPTVILFKDGEKVETIVGVNSKEVYQQKIDALLK